MQVDQPTQQECQKVPEEWKAPVNITWEEQRALDIQKWEDEIIYSGRYYDKEKEYRHVTLPRAIAQYMPRGKLLSEIEWRSLGLKQSEGWEHYLIHASSNEIESENIKTEEESGKKRRVLVPKVEEIEEIDESPTGVVEDLFNQLRFSQCISKIAWSSQNVIAWVSPKERDGVHILKPMRNNLSASDVYVDKWSYPQNASRSMTIDTEQFHAGNDIVNIVFNQFGNVLASIDRTGIIVLWFMEEFINEWKSIWNVDIKEPVVAFWWLAIERKWELANNSYQRAPFKGPRNRFGHLAFVAVTSSGKLSLFYQQDRRIFLKNTTQLEVSTNSFVTHTDYILNNDGRFILATYSANSLSSVVTISEVSIDLLLLDDANQKPQSSSPIESRTIANIDLSVTMADPADTKNCGQLIHLKLLSPSPQDNIVRVVLVMAEENEKSGKRMYHSNLLFFELNKTDSVPTKIEGTKSYDRLLNTRLLDRINIPKRLITSLWQHQTEVVIGFDNGQIEFRECSTLNLIINDEVFMIDDLKNQCLPSFSVWGIHSSRGDSIAQFTTSPNSAVLLCVRSSGQLDFIDIADSSIFNYLTKFDRTSIVSFFAPLLTLSLLNNIDHIDLENVLIKIAHEQKVNDFIELLLEAAFLNIVRVFPDGSNTSQSSELMNRLLGVQLSLLKGPDQDGVQYLNTLALMQLRTVDAAFQNSYSFNNSFAHDSLLSLLHLSLWVVDFYVNFVKNIYVHYNTFRQGRDLAQEKSHLTLFCNSQTRKLLNRIMEDVIKLRNYVTSLAKNNSGEPKINEIRDFLEEVFTKRCPITWEHLGAYIKNVSGLVEKAMEGDPNWQLVEYGALLRCVVPAHLHTTLPELEQQFKIFSSTFYSNLVYFYENDWVKSVDIINKARSVPMDRQCTRCGCFSSTKDYIHSRCSKNYMRSCLCGGLWKKLSK
ncbi:hypothetical protein G9A89_003876 [Geosiphon pyriformis]|nr:hypothetical protein G9A89_003876 [Geosiphon pyriformis]